MPVYIVRWIERVPRWCNVEADNAEEAMAKMVLGEIIEGTQDSGIGEMDNRTIGAVLREEN